MPCDLSFLGWESELDFTGLVIGLYATGNAGGCAAFGPARYQAG